MQETLVAHCDTQYVDEAAVRAVPVPDFTGSWRPYQHGVLLDALGQACQEEGLDVIGTKYSLDRSGAKLFGVWDVGNGTDGEYNVAIGIRNSMNKSFAAGICAGQHVFVCDNLMFSSEFVVLRRHTARFCEEEMVFIAQQAVAALGPQVQQYNEWLGSLKDIELTPSQAALLMMAAIQRKVMNVQQMGDFNDLYYQPDGRYTPTLHGFHGAATELMRSSTLFTVSKRNDELNGFLRYQAPLLLAEGDDQKHASGFSFATVADTADTLERTAKAETTAALKEATKETREEAKELRYQRVLAGFDEKVQGMRAAHFGKASAMNIAKLGGWAQALTDEIEAVPDDMSNRFNYRMVLKKARAQARRDLKAATAAAAPKKAKKAQPAARAAQGKGKGKPPTVVAGKGKKAAVAAAQRTQQPLGVKPKGRIVGLKGTATGKGSAQPRQAGAKEAKAMANLGGLLEEALAKVEAKGTTAPAEKTNAVRCHVCGATVLKGGKTCGACGALL